LNECLATLKDKAEHGKVEHRMWQSSFPKGVVQALRARGFIVDFVYMNSQESYQIVITWHKVVKNDLGRRLDGIEESISQLNANMQTLWQAPGMPGAIDSHRHYRQTMDILDGGCYSAF
jgi:hypothetical protein